MIKRVEYDVVNANTYKRIVRGIKSLSLAQKWVTEQNNPDDYDILCVWIMDT